MEHIMKQLNTSMKEKKFVFIKILRHSCLHVAPLHFI